MPSNTVIEEKTDERSPPGSRQRFDMILVLGSVVAQAGRLDEALALSEEHVARSLAEPGCIAHAVHRDIADPQRLVFIEKWADREALWQHFAVPASRAFGKSLAALAARTPTMEIFDATAVEVPRSKH